jgi:hypothetical protein
MIISLSTSKIFKKTMKDHHQNLIKLFPLEWSGKLQGYTVDDILNKKARIPVPRTLTSDALEMHLDNLMIDIEKLILVVMSNNIDDNFSSSKHIDNCVDV